MAVDMLRFALAAYPEDRVFMEPMVSLRWSPGPLPRLLLLMLPLLLAVSAPLPFDVGAGLAAAA